MIALQPTAMGLRLEAPAAGDVVTVRLRAAPQQLIPLPGPMGATLVPLPNPADPAHDACFYRAVTIWRVAAVNAGHAVVECLTHPQLGRQVWSIAHHEWFEASELWAAMQPPAPPAEPAADTPPRHCEERSDAAIQPSAPPPPSVEV